MPSALSISYIVQYPEIDYSPAIKLSQKVINRNSHIFIGGKMKKLLAIVCIAIIYFSSATFIQVSPTVSASNTISIKIDKAASSYEYGKIIGCRYYHMFHFLYALFNVFASHHVKENIFKYVESQKMVINQYSPSFLEELHGLSASLNIKIEALLALRSYFTALGGECTITASTGPATKNNQTFLTQNLDAYTPFSLDLYLFRLFFTRNIRIHDVESDLKYAYFGMPIILEYPLINEKGLGFGGTGTSITHDKNRDVDEGKGISPYWLVRQAMASCKNVSEVAILLEDSPRSSHRLKIGLHDWDYDNFVFCDREDGILIVEQTHSYIITVFGNSTEITNGSEGILWHANHHQWLDPSLTGSLYVDEYLTSEMRVSRTHELLETSYGNITLETCKNITRDHGGGYDENKKDSGDICRHPDRHGSWITSFAWIIQPKTMTAYWTRGAPCRTEFNEYNFTEVFFDKY